MSHKTPQQVLKESLLKLGSKGMDLKTACSRLGVSEETARKHCGFTDDELETFTAAQEAANEANKSRKLLNTVLTLKKSGHSDRSICAVLNCTQSALDAVLPKGTPPVPSYVRAIGAQIRKSTGINNNVELSQRMYATWKGVAPLDQRHAAKVAKRTDHPNLWERMEKAKTAAVGMKDKPDGEKDRTTSGEPSNSPGVCTYNVNVKQNRNLRAVGIFTGVGSGPTSTGEDDITSLTAKAQKTTLSKSWAAANLKEVRDIVNMIVTKAQNASNLEQGQSVAAFFLEQAPLSLRSQAAKALCVAGLQKLIPDRLAYLHEYVTV